MGHGLQNIGYANSCNESTLDAIAAEVMRARDKFPGTRFLLAALVEEVGELAEAVASKNPDEIKKEAVQVCAVAVRLIEEGDATTYNAEGIIAVVIDLGNVARKYIQRRTGGEAIEALSASVKRITYRLDPTFFDVTADEAKT